MDINMNINLNKDNNANSNEDMQNDVLTERSFYPPTDYRTHRLDIDDVVGGDSYYEYVIEFWELYEEELFC